MRLVTWNVPASIVNEFSGQRNTDKIATINGLIASGHVPSGWGKCLIHDINNEMAGRCNIVYAINYNSKWDRDETIIGETQRV